MGWLPQGYTFSPPQDIASRSTDTVGYREYGGADRSKATDGAGRKHKACCAWKDTALLRPDEQAFGFRIFVQDAPYGAWREIIYWGNEHVFCGGRGEINSQGGWIATLPDGSDDDGEIPGWVHLNSYVACQPNLYASLINGQVFSVGRWLNISDLYDLPVNCSAYCVRLVVKADRADIRARLGTDQQPGQVTANTQASNLQFHTVGIVNADASGRVWLSVVDGTGQIAAAQVWLTIGGYYL